MEWVAIRKHHRAWAAAFDAWLVSVEAARGSLRRKSCRFAWQNFWAALHRPPCQVEPAEFAQWIADLEQCAIIAGALGFTCVARGTSTVAKCLFGIFLVNPVVFGPLVILGLNISF